MAEQAEVLLETSVAFAQNVVEELGGTVTGMPGEAKMVALPVAARSLQLEFR